MGKEGNWDWKQIAVCAPENVSGNVQHSAQITASHQELLVSSDQQPKRANGNFITFALWEVI